ncbi:MAG: carbamate kinase [Coriobacteriales bacterium]|jgi:carbamate kinase|nr:carbamate kinase [Coriobacteriales bacterium]
MSERIVLALGGNALGDSLVEQRLAVASAAVPIADLIEAGHDVAICHGNGPQVGMIDLAFETASRTVESIDAMPLSTDGAMSQGYIGFGIQKALYRELHERSIDKVAASIVTQVLVDPADPAFENPSKPIGSFYTREEAEAIMQMDPSILLKEDAGRGWRRIVASPMPLEIIELKVIRSLIDCGYVVIACGGGGLPVIRDGSGLLPWEAVIDKDFTGELLAEDIDASVFLILTAVEKVAIDFGKPTERWLDHLSLEEAEAFSEEGQFAPGSMLPKVEAAMRFVRSAPGRKALITSLDRALDGIEGRTGTLVTA